MHRIIFTGAQGTGKTTILNYYKEQGSLVITEVVRNLSKKGVKINRDGDEDGQTKIFKEYKKLLGVRDFQGYFSDRGLIDVVAYTKQLVTEGKVSQEFYEKQVKNLKKFIADNPDIVYLYFPIEFAIEDDGVRDTDENYRNTIDANIRSLMEECNIPMITIAGSVEDRIGRVDKVRNWLVEGMKIYNDIWD